MVREVITNLPELPGLEPELHRPQPSDSQMLLFSRLEGGCKFTLHLTRVSSSPIGKAICMILS